LTDNGLRLGLDPVAERPSASSWSTAAASALHPQQQLQLECGDGFFPRVSARRPTADEAICAASACAS